MATAFVSCSKSKKSYPAPARDFYQGALFKKALAYAKAHFDHVYILSAKYGVIHPDQIIDYGNYDKPLKKMSKKEREEWYQLVKKQMQELNLPKPYVFFTGHLYYYVDENYQFEGEKPLEGLSIGKQLQWFNNRMRFSRSKRMGFNL
jgi:hypothetical protein